MFTEYTKEEMEMTRGYATTTANTGLATGTLNPGAILNTPIDTNNNDTTDFPYTLDEESLW